MFTDYFLNGKASGELAEGLSQVRFDPGLMRPFIDRKGHQCVMVNVGMDEKRNPVLKKRLVRDMVYSGLMSPMATNATTTLRKDEWLMFDKVIIREARQRLRAWSDLISRNVFGGFNGMAKTILEWETMSDAGEAIVDMDGLSEGRGDRPLYQLEGLPLPITHSSFSFSSRTIAVSRNSGTPLDTTMAEQAGRKVAEEIEKTLIGINTGLSYGTVSDYNNAPTVYGMTNHPDRNTDTTITTPDGTNGTTTIQEVLEGIETLRGDRFYGPYMLYHSTDWDKWLDDDYNANFPGTLRNRLREIDGIIDVRRLDFFTDTYSILLVQMTSDVVRAVNGMDITTVQWETKGGMQLNFKVMAIQVPQIRSDHQGRCGILHATTS